MKNYETANPQIPYLTAGLFFIIYCLIFPSEEIIDY